MIETLRQGLGLTMTAAALLALAACTAPGIPSGSMPVDESFSLSTGLFSTGTTIDVALKARNDGGMLAVCGAWGPSRVGGETRRLIYTASATGVVLVDGQLVLMDTSKFTEVPEDAPLIGANARCLTTGTPWEPGMERARVEARFAPQRYNVEPDNRGVRFRSVR